MKKLSILLYKITLFGLEILQNYSVCHKNLENYFISFRNSRKLLYLVQKF
jgi:hypothetical protein